MLIPFTKMQGLGNDYFYVDVTRNAAEEVRKAVLRDPSAFSLRWSDRHLGIGSDGLVLIGDSPRADFSMRIFNADGSEAKMCGNASRCIGKYVYEKGLTDKTFVTLDTLSGIKTLTLEVSSGKVISVTVDMGFAELQPVGTGSRGPRLSGGGVAGSLLVEGPIEADGRTFSGTAVSMGNPHLVIPVEDVTTFDVARYGSILERHPLFPDRVNVEFYSVLGCPVAAGYDGKVAGHDGKVADGHDGKVAGQVRDVTPEQDVTPDSIGGPIRLRMRVWERGSGITQACGTGACATAVAATLSKDADGLCEVVMDGGSLLIRYNPINGQVLMTGPAAFVFDGTIDLDNE